MAVFGQLLVLVLVAAVFDLELVYYAGEVPPFDLNIIDLLGVATFLLPYTF